MVSTFESSSPSRSVVGKRRGSRITAAATTGPASGPRPASSMPHTNPLHRRSNAQFAPTDGRRRAGAEVRVFAPGNSSRIARTGRTDAEGKFVFDADRDGFWSAEARNADYVARIMIR